MRLRFILPELEGFTWLNPARYRADIHDDELNFPRSEQATDVIFGERYAPCGRVFFGRRPFRRKKRGDALTADRIIPNTRTACADRKPDLVNEESKSVDESERLRLRLPVRFVSTNAHPEHERMCAGQTGFKRDLSRLEVGFVLRWGAYRSPAFH
jgi:hypothetical protein